MNEIELIAKQQLEIENLKLEISAIKDTVKLAQNELIYAEQWRMKADKFPSIAMSAIVKSRDILGSI